MTAKGGPFMVDVEVDCRVGHSAKDRKRGADCLNGVHPFPDAGMPSGGLPSNCFQWFTATVMSLCTTIQTVHQFCLDVALNLW
jgi:hypothetical protein